MILVQAERLIELAKFLENNVPPEQFDYSTFLSSNGVTWDPVSLRYEYPDVQPELKCGTSACALGWAATMPTFQKLGLTIGQDKNKAPVLRFADEDEDSDAWLEDQAIDAIFGEDSNHLFYPQDSYDVEDAVDEHASPQEVAARIRRHVEAAGFAQLAAS